MEVKRKMAKKSKRRLLFTSIMLAALLVCSAYAVLVPNVYAAEMTIQQKGLSVLSNVVGVDLAKYDVATEENSISPPSLGGVLQEDILYSLTSDESTLKAHYTFADGNLRGIYVLEREGTPSLIKPATSVNAVESAQDFLSNYQAYTAKPVIGELKATLNNVNSSKNLTKTVGDKVLQVTAYDDHTRFKWCYTANGARAPYSKVVAMSFKDGFLHSFIDNWDLYSIGSTSVNLSKEEAVAIALDVARKHSWTMQLDEDTLDPSNFNEKRSVSWTALIFDGSLDADNTRSEDVLELYPVWRVGLVLNKVYGELYGIEVDIWADTKEVRSVKEEYSQLAALWFENSTANTDTSAVFFGGAVPNFAMGILLSATTVSVMGAFAAVLVKKKPRALHKLKPRFLKTCVILLGFLIVLAVFSPLVATANAATRAATIWGSRSTGAQHPLFPDIWSWRKLNDEKELQDSVSEYLVDNFFNAAHGYSGEDNTWVNADVIISQAYSFSNNYDYVAVVDWDHGVTGLPGQTSRHSSVPDYEEHYMFEDDYGTLVGSYPGSQDWSHGVYDIDMYNAFPPAKVHFAFIDACYSADYYAKLGQGYSASGYPLGMPFAFTHRLVAYVPEGYTGTLMSIDGYHSPDAFPQCYIGFPTGAAALSQPIPFDNGPQWYQWIIFFFYLAVDCNYSVNDALDSACWYHWQIEEFPDSPLQGSGFYAFWPLDKDGNGIIIPPEEWPGAEAFHSTLAVYGNGNINLRSFNPSDMVTWPYVSGPSVGNAGVSYQFSARSIDSQGHDINYTFNWGDGSEDVTEDWHDSGETVYMSHSWSSGGTYNVKVKAQCDQGTWSSWSSPHTIDIGEIHQLTVLAINQYNQPGAVPLAIDYEYVGTTPYTCPVTEGYHTIGVGSPLYGGGEHVFVCYYYDGIYNGSNPMTLSITEDKTVYACYYSYYW
jgi:competence protein ComGC